MLNKTNDAIADNTVYMSLDELELSQTPSGGLARQHYARIWTSFQKGENIIPPCTGNVGEIILTSTVQTVHG